MGSQPKYGRSGCFEGREVPASSAFLGSWRRIFNQPTLEAQPLREASTNFWEIWMKWGSNLSLFFFQQQLRKLNLFENWDFYNLFTFSTLSGWPCRLPDKHNFLLKLCLYFNVVDIAITWHAQSIGAPSVNKLPPKYFQFYRPDPRISLGHICKEIKLNIFALRFFSWFESSNF